MATATMARTGPRTRSATYLGLFLVTLSSLMFEVVLTRIFSVTMWYHFAFVAISVALFGTTAGALLVYFRPHAFPDDRVKEQMWRYSLAFGVSVALCFLTQLIVPFMPGGTLAEIWSVAFTCVLISIPFTLGGVVVCLALTRFPDKTNRLYAADLIGGGLGCIALVVAFNWFDGPSLVMFVGALGCLGAYVFAVDAGSGTGKKAAAICGSVLILFSVLNAVRASQSHPMLRIVWAKGEKDPRHRYELWNAYSRVTIDGNEDVEGPPAGNGLSPITPPQTMRQMNMLIDSTAGTAAIGKGDHNFLRYDISNLAYWARPKGRAAVVGVGGGRDVASALEFGAEHVTGIEINSNILSALNGTLGEFTGHLDRNPRVTFVNDEARSWLTRTDERFDVLQISLIDTWAATQAGALALSENSLYTTQAWDTFLDRLQPDGILTVSRWFSIFETEPFETYRTVSLAAQTLTDRGVENPRDHILVFKGPDVGGIVSVATVLVSPTPFSAADQATLQGTAARLQFQPILTPESSIDARMAELVAPGGPGPALDSFAADVSAPNDDRPFFFQMVNLKDVVRGRGMGSESHIYRAVYTLSILAITVTLMALLAIVLPLIIAARRAKQRGEHLPSGMRPYYVFFAGIGLAFLLVEVSQLQRLGVFLGHPVYSLTVVLFTVLVFSGIGSFVSERLVNLERPKTVVAPFAALLVLLAAFGLLAPELTHSLAGETTPMRIAVAVAMLAPIAFFMGMPFAIGMRLAGRTPGAPVAYFWGINGATSVVASVMGATIALFFGINASFFAGALAYVVATAAVVWALRTPPAVSSPPGEVVVGDPDPDDDALEAAAPAPTGV